MGKRAPAQPDPVATASAQTAMNKDALKYSAKINAVDTNSPWGSSTYTRDAEGVPTAQNISLSPTEQAYYDKSSSIRNSLTGNLPTGAFTAPDTTRADAVEKALYDRRMNLVRPDLEAADNAKRVELADRGIPIGSEIYQNENDRLARNRQSVEDAAAQDAVNAGGAEQDRLLSNALTMRNQPFNELASFSGGVPTQLPQFSQTPNYQLQPGDYAGQVNSNYQNAAADYNNRTQSLWSGLFGLGKAALAPATLSDRRTKKDIRRIGETDAGLPLYQYKYKDGIDDGATHIGAMADEVADFFPDAVVPAGMGDLQAVDYGAIA